MECHYLNLTHGSSLHNTPSKSGVLQFFGRQTAFEDSSALGKDYL
jgi:hypothetical protein